MLFRYSLGSPVSPCGPLKDERFLPSPSFLILFWKSREHGPCYKSYQSQPWWLYNSPWGGRGKIPLETGAIHHLFYFLLQERWCAAFFFFFFGRWPINRLGLLYHHKTGQPHRGMKTIMGGYFYPSPAVPVYLFFFTVYRATSWRANSDKYPVSFILF